MDETIHLSFIRLKGKIVDNYERTKAGWKSKYVLWKDVVNVVSNSNVQYSPFEWRNGYKTPKNWSNDKQDCIVLDIDDGLTIPQIQKRLNRYTYCLATTKTHQKEKKGITCDRFRVIIKAINVSNKSDIFFRAMKLFAPYNDEQTLMKTASFLGNDDAIVIYNEGKALDMFTWNELAKEEIQQEINDEVEKIVVDPDFINSYGMLTVQDVKPRLTYEIVMNIIEDLGYELERGKFRLRDERTASTKVKHKSLNIIDYGGSFKGDIFQLLMDYHQMSFRDAIRYVNSFI